MVTDLETTLGIASQARDWEADADRYGAIRSGLYEAGFVTLWELQSQLATIVLITLVAFAPTPVTLAVMLGWSLVASVVYFHGRKRGLPDVFETRWTRPALAKGRWLAWATATAVSVLKAWLAGIQPFVYARAVSGFLSRPVRCWRTRLARCATLSLALVLFGVTAAHHLLRHAGYSDAKVLQLCLVGSFLNVTYRVLLSTLIIGAIAGLTGQS